MTQYFPQVDAYPPVVTFRWFFNNSDHSEELAEERFSSDGVTSALDFRPGTAQDYGTLYCVGENTIGKQQEPCAFQIVPTGEYRSPSSAPHSGTVLRCSRMTGEPLEPVVCTLTYLGWQKLLLPAIILSS